MTAHTLSGGFSDAPIDAAFAFRTALTAMARPGEIGEMSGATPPSPLSQAAGALILTLCDQETPLHLAGDLDAAQVREWITFHTGAPLVSAQQAMFAAGDWHSLSPLSRFPIGTAEYPDRSATLIVECDHLSPDGATLSGPGIKDTNTLSVPDVEALQDNASRFPLGLDFYFTCKTSIAGLPRTTRVTD